MSIKSLVKQVLTEKENRRYQRQLSDKCVSYPEWLKEQESACWGLGNAWKNVADEFFVLSASEGALAKGAIENITCYFMKHPEVQLLYGDEDVCGESAPWFKPDWSPDLLDSQFYFGSLVAVRRDLFERCCVVFGNAGGEQGENLPFEPMDAVAGSKEAGNTDAGIGAKENEVPKAYRKRVSDFGRYEQWMHICVGLAGGYQCGNHAIGHFPGILFHCCCEREQEKFLETTPFLRRRREELLWAFRESESRSEMISVVIPSKDNPEILRKCMEGCLAVATCAVEIIVVDNGSNVENKTTIENSLREFCKQTTGGIACDFIYLYEPMEFNFSKMCNMGAERAKGNYLLFLNDDVELCQKGCLEEMAVLAGRDYTGAVGMKLYYPDSKRIQHAGITNLPMGPVHKLQFKEDNARYYYGANDGCRNVLAVTAACLMVEKDKYLETGGFSEELRVAFNDVDFCFRLYELGYYNVCVNDSYAYHHESMSRGADESFEKLERLLGEREKLYARHAELEGVDPYYSIYLNREGLDTSIRPGYVTGANVTQTVEGLVEILDITNYRQDNCLMLRVEDARKGRMVGYGIVLGDDNACYDKSLLLQKEAGNIVLGRKILGQYRPDLKENLSDQVNVALCGFDIKVDDGAIPKGRYLVGMAARNRVTGLKLVNWSNRVVEL